MPDRCQQGKTKITYRADVDGLRAVAVLLVILDHTNTRVTGGYIGVDVFFVISGYLISAAILSEMASGTFSVANFYERRIRRILPALLVMLMGCVVITWLFCIPSETEVFARSLLSALFSVSNFFFWHQSRPAFFSWQPAGYFEISHTGVDTLLHTWSLAVEEQFYIFFPLFLIAVRRWFSSQLKIAIWGVTIVTFLLASVCVYKDPTAAFYFAPLRAWELLIGTIVSQHYLPAIQGKWVRNVAAMAGLLLILVPAKSYDAFTHFPGLAAVPPCIGAALIIAAGETGDSMVGRLLGWRPIVFMGLISYSLYLWHWPIITSLEENYVPLTYESSKGRKLAVLAVIFIAGTLSWLLVERPFRQGRFRLSRRPLFLVNGIAVAVLACIAGLMIVTQGAPYRFAPDAIAIDKYASFDIRGSKNYDPASAFRKDVCFIDPRYSGFEQFNKEVCLRGDPARKEYLLVGDSYGAHLYPGLQSVFPELNITQATTAGCSPLLDLPRTESCDRKMSEYIYRDYLIHHRVDAILIAGRWHEGDIPYLERTMSWIKGQGIEPILFGPVPDFDVPLPRLLIVSQRKGDPTLVDRHRVVDTEQTDKHLARLARDEWKVRYVSAYENLCASRGTMKAEASSLTGSGCAVYAGPGVPLIFDKHHFTVEGSVLYAQTMRANNQLP